MAETKTRPMGAAVTKFLDGIADEKRREDCRAVTELMRELTGEEPAMWGASIVGFGKYHYRYDSGREGDSMIVGFSPRKSDLTLYLMHGIEEERELLSRLGKHKTGKSCLYLKRFADVDGDVLRELIARSIEKLETQRVRG